ncbi:MAG: hypothetical protein PHV34_08480 [Verrucomicrobiae bacterium]|nr:hypothetical protein [Verrucomicrobiae bacterium]
MNTRQILITMLGATLSLGSLCAKDITLRATVIERELARPEEAEKLKADGGALSSSKAQQLIEAGKSLQAVVKQKNVQLDYGKSVSVAGAKTTRCEYTSQVDDKTLQPKKKGKKALGFSARITPRACGDGVWLSADARDTRISGFKNLKTGDGKQVEIPTFVQQSATGAGAVLPADGSSSYVLPMLSSFCDPESKKIKYVQTILVLDIMK